MIARRCGFTGDAVFSRAFRNAYGMSPSEVRTTAKLGYLDALDSERRSGGSFWEFGGPDLERAKLFVMLGTAEDHHSNPLKIAIAKFKRDGGRFISVNPVRTGYSAIADEWVGIRPGTDGKFVLALVHELLRADRIDLERIIVGGHSRGGEAAGVAASGVAPGVPAAGREDYEQQVASARNALLLLMVLFENIHIGNCRSETKSALRLSPFRSPFLLSGAIGALLVHVAAMYLPPLQRAGTERLFVAMRQDAVEAGRRVLEAERALDAAFAEGASEVELVHLVRNAAARRGDLRQQRRQHAWPVGQTHADLQVTSLGGQPRLDDAGEQHRIDIAAAQRDDDRLDGPGHGA